MQSHRAILANFGCWIPPHEASRAEDLQSIFRPKVGPNSKKLLFDGPGRIFTRNIQQHYLEIQLLRTQWTTSEDSYACRDRTENVSLWYQNIVVFGLGQNVGCTGPSPTPVWMYAASAIFHQKRGWGCLRGRIPVPACGNKPGGERVAGAAAVLHWVSFCQKGRDKRRQRRTG